MWKTGGNIDSNSNPVIGMTLIMNSKSENLSNNM